MSSQGPHQQDATDLLCTLGPASKAGPCQVQDLAYRVPEARQGSHLNGSFSSTAATHRKTQNWSVSVVFLWDLVLLL